MCLYMYMTSSTRGLRAAMWSTGCLSSITPNPQLVTRRTPIVSFIFLR